MRIYNHVAKESDKNKAKNNIVGELIKMTSSVDNVALTRICIRCFQCFFQYCDDDCLDVLAQQSSEIIIVLDHLINNRR